MAIALFCWTFQSTLPYGSDQGIHHKRTRPLYFNPRSLTGATAICLLVYNISAISIHAPLRERQSRHPEACCWYRFQSTLPYGSDSEDILMARYNEISIHAPLRERQLKPKLLCRWLIFQSTLPYGSDAIHLVKQSKNTNFNPRSLTGATIRCCRQVAWMQDFNPRSLTGATASKQNTSPFI